MKSDTTPKAQEEKRCNECGLTIRECNERTLASLDAFSEMWRDPNWLASMKERPKAFWEVAFEKGWLAARSVVPEAQVAWSFDMEAAPRNGTPLDLWCFNRRVINYRWDTEGRFGGWWSDVRHKDRHWRDRECLMPASVSAWRLADTPPSSNQKS